ncbi:MAG TPA: CpsD/CapB family tyrosine-protein kinase [Candidatus Acidoferrales bacterium]|nr:CpsD/CapB family tyrosine-protein kinase [Candidatus Acidoferrales bacterium]
MSRNFELLQQVGKEGGLFQTPNPPKVQSDEVASHREPADDRPPIEGTARAKRGADPMLSFTRQREEMARAENHRATLNLEAMARAEELKLVQRLLVVPASGAGRLVMFSGVADDLGCALICARSAEILAGQTKASVCLVDANLGSPSLHQLFHVENRNGLADAIRSQSRLRDCAQRLPHENLWLIPAGSLTASDNGFLVSAALRSALQDLREGFEHVLICAPAVSRNPDSLLIGQLMDGVFLVLEADSTRREVARKVKEDLEAANARLLGVVLNNRKFPVPESIYRRL